jgi:WD40 repeat protein
MDVSHPFQGSHIAPSPTGQYIASITTNNSLRISPANAPDSRYTDVPLHRTSPAKEIIQLKWNSKGDHIAVLSAKNIEIIDLDDAAHHVRIDNGSAGFGRFCDVQFIISDHAEAVMVMWEFGKVKVWDLGCGKAVDLGEIKGSVEGRRWGVRPSCGRRRGSVLIVLSRVGADDVLNFYLVDEWRHFKAVKLPTADAQAVEWSPDGRWIAVMDIATANQGVHFFTPDGCLFRSYPQTQDSGTLGLGIKEVVWAGNSHVVALTRHDNCIVLLNSQTFAPLAVIEHTTTIDQRSSMAGKSQAPIWQEAVSSSNDRSYTSVAQPFSPPLSRTKTSTEPAELGVAEARFSCDGNWLATRDERMLNTVWIWNMFTLGAHAVLVQHSNVRRLHWHPTKAEELMLDCGEGIAYLLTPRSLEPPTPLLSAGMNSQAVLSWLESGSDGKSTILAAMKSTFRLLYPEGQPEDAEGAEVDESFEEGVSEDSLFDVLSGRKPLPPKTEQSYTERVDFEVETEEEGSSMRIDDTFREKKERRPVEVDPLDDSEIF